jgi:hypothetical protein
MTEKKIKLLVFVMVILGLVIQGINALQGTFSITKIERPKAGEDAEEVTLVMKGDGEDEEITFQVDGQLPEEETVETYFNLAKTEVDESFLGDNASFEEITKNVVLKNSYVDGVVDATWSFSPGKIITTDGQINFEEVEEDTLVECNVTFEAYDKEISYSFPVFVKLPDAGKKDGFLYYIKKALETRNNEERENGELELPLEVEGRSVEWRKKVSHTGLEISVLGIFMGLFLIFGKKYDEKKEKEKKMEEYVRYYPEIISALTLYMGAGLSSRQAFEKIGELYQKQTLKKGVRKAPYENVLVLNRELRDGKNTKNAYEDFGRRCMHPAYKKMMMLFEQNMRKGNEYLLEQLEREERNVYETRQRKIKTAGEVASTKMLIPMGGLLAMVLIILVVPALYSIQI